MTPRIRNKGIRPTPKSSQSSGSSSAAAERLMKNTVQRVDRVSSDNDSDNLASAVLALVSRFNRIVDDPSLREIMNFVLDSKYAEERTKEESMALDRFYDVLKSITTSLSKREVVEQLSFEAATLSFADPRKKSQPVESIFCQSENGNNEIYVSDRLGFKGSVIAAHASFSDFFVQSAKDAGVKLQPGDIGKLIFEIMAHKSFPKSQLNKNGPLFTSVKVNGSVVLSCVVRREK